jgi:hypothetical protein
VRTKYAPLVHVRKHLGGPGHEWFGSGSSGHPSRSRLPHISPTLVRGATDVARRVLRVHRAKRRYRIAIRGRTLIRLVER